MDVRKKLETAGELSVASHRDLADKVLEAEGGLVELAREMGISVAALRKWSMMVEPPQDTAAGAEDTLVPSSRVHELGMETGELKALLDSQGGSDPGPEGRHRSRLRV
jgi:hypothetical protein